MLVCNILHFPSSAAPDLRDAVEMLNTTVKGQAEEIKRLRGRNAELEGQRLRASNDSSHYTQVGVAVLVWRWWDVAICSVGISVISGSLGRFVGVLC